MIDLREEIKELVEDHHETIILRHMRERKCTCWRRGSNTPDPECPNCQGSGYLFKETFQKVRLAVVTIARVAHEQDFEYGKTYSNMMTIYFPINKSSMGIMIDDLIYEIKSDENGMITKPLTRLRKWVITEVFRPKLDGAKAQFVKVLAKPLNA